MPTIDQSGTALIPNITAASYKAPATISPGIITSKPATNDLNNIKTTVSNVNTGITNQATKVSTDKATADANAKATADANAAAKTAADKAAADKALADAKLAAINGMTPPAPAAPAIPTDQVFSNGINRAPTEVKSVATNADGTRTVTYKDNTSQVVGANPNPETPTAASAAEQLAQTNQDYQNKANAVTTTINNIQNGTIPLTPGEQAQVDGLKQQFQTLIDSQNLENTNASGVANIRGYQIGAGEYNPAFQISTIGSIVSAGQQKIADLNIKMASAIASLTQSFKDNDIKAVKDAYAIYQDAAKERTDSLQKVIDASNAAIKDAYTKQQDAIKNALDATIESDKVSYQDKQIALDNAKLTETERHDRATELIQKQANGGGNLPGFLPAVTMTAQGTPSSAEQAKFLASFPPLIQTQIKGLANYDLNPASFSTSAKQSQGNLTQGQLVSLAQQYDPSYSESQYAARAAYKKSMASNTQGSIGGAINSANKAVNHLSAFVNDLSKTANTWSSTTNFLLNNTVGNLVPGLRQTLGSAKTEGIGVADELAKFFKGSGATDVKSIDDWKSQLSTNASPADVQGLTQGAITLLAGQLETLSEQYKTTMGRAPDNNLLGASATKNLQNLKNMGYTVNIPGVNYTDKDAYFKYGGGSSQDLINAHTMLVNANDPNNPPTPENALELAQLLGGTQ